MQYLNVVTIIEVVLFIAVWLRGWRGVSAFPVALVMLAGFLAGLLKLPVSDTTFAVFDAIGIVIWVVMLFVWPLNLPSLGSILRAADSIPAGTIGPAVWPFGKEKTYMVVNTSSEAISKGDLVQVVGRRGFRSTLIVRKYKACNES